MFKHYLIRPPKEAIEVHKWNGKEWILDDGKPGLAFSAKISLTKAKSGNLQLYPKAYYPYCNCGADSNCPSNIASRYTTSRWGCSNGCTVQSKKEILAELRKKRSEARKVKRQILKEKLDIRRKNELEYWLEGNNIPATLELTNGKVLVSLDVLEELKNRLNRANGR